MEYKQVQQIAKDTMEYAKEIIKPGMNLREIRRLCDEKMLELGADSFWYWDIGTFIFSGDETAVSVSGKQYVTSDRIIAPNDIITLDLSPQNGDTWGDYARTLILQDGCLAEADAIVHMEWKQGILMEEDLHRELLRFAKPEMTLEALYVHMNQLIERAGFINLDFSGNVGHTIVKQKSERTYIKKGSSICLKEAGFFTFEPHIGIPGSPYGFKKENIYFFENSVLREL